MSSPLLSVEGIHAHYGKSHVLQGVSLQVRDGELVTLLGRNGAGKTTTLKTIKAAGVAILLVEQNLEVCTQLADRHYIIEQGAIAHEASNTAFLSDDAVKDRYLGVGIA
jgi:ABC-type branched-subunit amino acid transport system ATPase component